MPKPRIMFYHDGRHPHIYRYEPPMQKEEYQACIDELVGTPVEAIMFCLGEGRTVLHDTKVGELLGHNVDKWDHLVFHRAHQNAKSLIEAGHDPLRIVCERAHEKGLLLYPTLLVQNFGPEMASVRCSDFRWENRHLEIGARGDLDPDMPWIDGLDFKHREVQDERFDLIEETLNEYSVDGFELQLNNYPRYFHPNEVEAGIEVMTDWIGRVHEAVKRSGADRELVIRVPASLEDALSIGLDLETWVRDGIVDAFIGEPFSAPHRIDPNTDFRPLAAIVKGSACRCIAAIHSHVDSDRLAEAPISMVRATACNYWEQGIDGLYLAQWFPHWPYQADFYERLREIPHPDIMEAKDKYYYIPTENARPHEPWVSTQLPIKMEENKPVTAKFIVSDNLPRWDEIGRVHEVLLRVGIAGTTELDQIRFSFNGKVLSESILRKINQMYRMSGPRNRSGPTYWFVFRLDRAHFPQRGENALEVTLLERDPDVLGDVSLRDVELELKYLMGRNFHRGFVDPDLGHYGGGVS